MKCTKCGFENAEYAKFCNNCGAEFHDETTIVQKENVPSNSVNNNNKGDKRITLLCLMVALAFVICGTSAIFISDTYEIYKNSNSSNTSSQNTRYNYKFTSEQVDFLKSIGINPEKYYLDNNGKVNIYDNNAVIEHGDVYVTLDKNDEIVEITYGKYGYDDRLYWNKEYGKVGMSIAEKNAFIKEFVDSHDKKYDQARQKTYVDYINSFPFGITDMYLEFVYDGKDDDYKKSSNYKSIYANLHYSGENWIFFKEVIFSNSIDSWTYTPSTSTKRDVVRGGVHENLFVSMKDIIKGLKILVSGDNPQIDFVGDYRRTITISEEKKALIKQYIKLYDALDK